MESEKKWRRCRSDDLCKSAWNWCENNGLVEYDEKRKCNVVDAKTMNMISDSYNLAKCVFNGTQRKERLQCERFVKAVGMTA